MLMLANDVCNLARGNVNGEVSFFSGPEVDSFANKGILTFFSGFINMQSVDTQVKNGERLKVEAFRHCTKITISDAKNKNWLNLMFEKMALLR